MIITRLAGGMGNQMFQYALGRRLSVERNVPLKLDTTFLLQRISMPHALRPHFVFRNVDLDVYNIHATVAAPQDMRWWQRPILSGKISVLIDALLRKVPVLPGWEKGYSFDNTILSMKGDVYLAGFWQSEKYFSSIRNVLLKDFTLKNTLSEQSASLRAEIQEKNAVCVFVRRSDILKKTFHGAIERSYYDEALAYIARSQSVEKIYIFSDDIEWCKEHLHFPFETMYVGNEYAGKKWEEHMVLMSACRHFIIPNSTFAWWGAWLATNEDKIVIAPKKWFTATDINTDDLIPTTWVRL